MRLTLPSTGQVISCPGYPERWLKNQLQTQAEKGSRLHARQQGVLEQEQRLLALAVAKVEVEAAVATAAAAEAVEVEIDVAAEVVGVVVESEEAGPGHAIKNPGWSSLKNYQRRLDQGPRVGEGEKGLSRREYC